MNEKQKSLKRQIYVDEDSLEVMFIFDDQWNVWIGQYPYFKDEPRYTPSGRPWRNASYTGCNLHTDPEYNDCGSCEWLVRERKSDLIGVCFHSDHRKKGADAG